MRRVTHTAILARAIRDCESQLKAESRKHKVLHEKGKTDEAMFFYDNIIRNTEAELETLKELYRVETGTDY